MLSGEETVSKGDNFKLYSITDLELEHDPHRFCHTIGSIKSLLPITNYTSNMLVVSEQCLKGTSAQYRQFSATQLKAEEK